MEVVVEEVGEVDMGAVGGQRWGFVGAASAVRIGWAELLSDAAVSEWKERPRRDCRYSMLARKVHCSKRYMRQRRWRLLAAKANDDATGGVVVRQVSSRCCRADVLRRVRPGSDGRIGGGKGVGLRVRVRMKVDVRR